MGIAAHVIAARWRNLAAHPQEVASEMLEELAASGDKNHGGNGNGNSHYPATQAASRDLAEVEQRAMIAKLIDVLPDDQRLVITRRFLEHRSIREIAQEVGRTEGAVKQLQFRALENLRAHIRSHRNV